MAAQGISWESQLESPTIRPLERNLRIQVAMRDDHRRKHVILCATATLRVSTRQSTIVKLLPKTVTPLWSALTLRISKRGTQFCKQILPPVPAPGNKFLPTRGVP